MEINQPRFTMISGQELHNNLKGTRWDSCEVPIDAADLFANLIIIENEERKGVDRYGIYNNLRMEESYKDLPSFWTTHYDFYFDFRDENNDLVLPFSHIQPLWGFAAPYENIVEKFPEIKKAVTFKGGLICSTDKRNSMRERKIVSRFPTMSVIYFYGGCTRFDYGYRCGCTFCDYLELSSYTSTTVKELVKMKKERDDLYRPGGLISELGGKHSGKTDKQIEVKNKEGNKEEIKSID